MADRRDTLDVAGPSAPPRSNGALVFAAPWESRIFGITMAMHDAGVFEWDEFRPLLIAEISRWQAAAEADSAYSYYERWYAALRTLLEKKDLCGGSDLDARVSELGARPAGHDH